MENMMVQKAADKKGRIYEFVEGDPLRTRIYTLDNGLKVYLSPNDRRPEVQVFVGVKAGSDNDPLEATGLAHYLEHLMFKGTKKIGTVDYEREKPILDKIEALFEEYGRTTDPVKRKEIYSEIDKVSNEASKLAVAQEEWKLFESIGAKGMNAATGNYRTFYESVIPSGELRRWAMLESDRFMNPVFRGFHTELETVYEEYNMCCSSASLMTDNLLDEIGRHLYKDIPYWQHSVIGKPEHLKNPSLKSLKEFYKTYYCANNMAVILCGDLNYEASMDIVEEYFGQLRRNDLLPREVRYKVDDLTTPVRFCVTDPNPERMFLVWKIPGVVHPFPDELMDTQKLIMGMSILSDSDCGMLDDMVDTCHQALSVDLFIVPRSDYSTLCITAQPNEGQSMEDLKEKLLAVVARLKAGDFEESRLMAALNQSRKLTLENRKENRYRADLLLDSFVCDLSYSDTVGRIDRYMLITKEDVMDVASRYLTDGYLFITKQTGPSSVTAIEKPEISPLDLGVERQSEFAREFLAMSASQPSARFPDFRNDMRISSLSTGQKFIYRHNEADSIFYLRFSTERGFIKDKWQKTIPGYLDQLGTDAMSSGDRKNAFYEMASEVEINIALRSGSIEISGMQEHFGRTVAIASDWMVNAKADDDAFRALADARIAGARKSKDDFNRCQMTLFQYCTFGGMDYVQKTTITPDELAACTGSDILDHAKAFIQSMDTITYFGPAGEDEVRCILEGSLLAKAFDGKKLRPTVFPCQDVTAPRVYVQDYDSPSSFIIMRACWGQTMHPGEEAYYELLKKCTSIVANQEMREARSLTYLTHVDYYMPITKGEPIDVCALALTQNSKVPECMETLEHVCRDLPLSESVFSRVKEQMIASLRVRRILDNDIIETYMSEFRLGYDHDHMEDVYRDIQGITLEDLKEFHRSKTGDHPFLYAIVGKVSDIDLDYLKSKGDVTFLSKEETFGF